MSEHRLAGPPVVQGVSEGAVAVQHDVRRRFRLPAATRVASRGVLLAFLLTGVLGIWHIDRYPRTWFDEGSYLEVSRNIAERGQYFAEAPDGTRDFAPVIAVGPTVLVPAAIAQEVLGYSLRVSRLVGVVYLMLASVALCSLTRRLFGERAAMLTFVLLLAMPALDWLGTGRQLLGETPALLFLIVGAGLAFNARCLRTAGIAGLVFGLAMITKGQYLLVLPPVLVLIGLFDTLTSRVRPIRWYASLIGAAVAAYAGWFLVLLALIGEGSILENYRLLRDSSSGALLVFNLDRMQAAWTLLLGPRALLLVVPSIAYGLYLIYREEHPARRLALGSIWLFQVSWLGWFAMASIAWPRYAFPGLALSTIFAGIMISDLVAAFRRSWESRRVGSRLPLGLYAAGLGVIGLLLGAGIVRQVSPIFTADEREPQQFAAALDATLPEGAIVDGWEPEINFLSQHDLQYPPTGSLDRVVRAAWLGSEEEVDLSQSLSADYLVIGHFGRWVGVYESALSSGAYRPVLSQGGYELYERNDGS